MKTNNVSKMLNEISTKLVSIVVDVEIEGIAPLLQNNIEGSAEQMARKGKRSTGGVKDDPEEWKGKIYRIKDGLGHPGGAIDSALTKAARDFKADKRRSMADVIKATCYVNETFLTLIGKSEPDLINRSSVVNPHTKGRGFVYRPMFETGWRASFSLTIADLEMVEKDRVLEILQHAGRRCGIGDWRPKFGRFSVVKFETRK
jgi:hypothetical protein